MKNIYKYLLIFTASALVVSCGESDLEPTLALDKDLDSGIQSAADLSFVLNSAYDRMSETGYYGRDQIIMGDVRTDNAYSNMNSGRFANSDMDYSPNGAGPWSTVYRVIAITNIVINADTSNLTGSAGEITHIQGQAHALRALAHFDLLQDYGQHFIDGQGGASALGVPYVKTYKDPANLEPARGTVVSNIGDIAADLTTAIGMMDDSFNSSSSYMSKAGAYAILARATLYAGSVDPSLYATADSAAKWVIANSGASPVSASGFASSYTTDNASNSIFELAFSGTDNRGINGIAYILRGTSYGDVRILTGTGANPDLLDIYDVDDVRAASNMIGTAQGYPTMLGKFPTMSGADNITLFRVEEMHLIAAETSLRAGNSAAALSYLNNIPAIRGLGAGYYASATLENILEERRKEFAFEGLRFHDLSRMGMDMPQIDSFKQLNDDLTGTPPAYGSFRYAYPIAQSERSANPNMVQNYGY
ncbi:RagB/SusD family nutrient uptake outer membrane protein [Flavobacteriaceae bacterium]|nr:RagB/SusD family nutrient uptake outer membrane protein [Flavobacteriaceae bacterium]MDB4144971.1 RagB/SusD family nutrient uptake outer membrane protein [Flavobacteriaceae bacterium]